MTKRDYLLGASVGLGVSLAEALLSALLLRNAGRLLSLAGEAQLGEIFSALKYAGLFASPIIFLLSASALAACVILQRHGRHMRLMAALTALVSLAGLFGTLICMRVNGVPVYCALGVISDIAASGIL